jgi:hypothetical protein
MSRAELVCMVASLALGFVVAGLRRSAARCERLCARNVALAEELDKTEHARRCARDEATRWKLRALRHGWNRDR